MLIEDASRRVLKSRELMPPSQTPHRTPLRRISQGSLLRLSRSGNYPDAPDGLGFLEPALAELVDETEALQTNVDGLANLSDSLATFNESFASWLYVMNMNALTTDWPQVCNFLLLVLHVLKLPLDTNIRFLCTRKAKGR
jgi:hypothetical protein